MDLSPLLIALLVVIAAWTALVLGLALAGRRLMAREFAMFAPNIAILFGRLMRDQRVPLRAKIVLVFGMAYAAMPIDIIPDFIPFAGQLDDLVMAVIVLRQVARWTSTDVIRANWRGEPGTIDRVLRLARV